MLVKALARRKVELTIFNVNEIKLGIILYSVIKHKRDKTVVKGSKFLNKL